MIENAKLEIFKCKRTGKLSVYINDYRITPRNTKMVEGNLIEKFLIKNSDLLDCINNKC